MKWLKNFYWKSRTWVWLNWLLLKNFNWKSLLGVILIGAGVFVGFYVGVWFCFIGGIVAFIEAVQCDPVVAIDIALSIARVFFASLIGWVSAIVFLVPGATLLK